MKTRINWNKVSGYVLIVAAVLGWLISIAGITSVWVARPSVTRDMVELANTTYDTLIATRDTLIVIGSSLDTVREAVGQIREGVDALNQTVDGVIKLVNSVSSLVGDGLTNAVSQAQKTIDAIRDGAKLVGNTLSLLNSLPLVGDLYKPEQPLESSVAKLSTDMQGINDTLGTIKADVSSSNSQLESFSLNLKHLSTQLEEIETSLKSTRTVINDYILLLDKIIPRLDSFRKNLPGILITSCILITLILVWLILNQYGWFMNGYRMVRGGLRVYGDNELVVVTRIHDELPPSATGQFFNDQANDENNGISG